MIHLGVCCVKLIFNLEWHHAYTGGKFSKIYARYGTFMELYVLGMARVSLLSTDYEDRLPSMGCFL